MLKITLFASVVASLFMGTNVAAGVKTPALKNRDSIIIIESERSEETLTEEGIVNNQDMILNNIRNSVTNNFKVVQRYHNIGNAIAISVNQDDIENIKKVPGIASVTVNRFHEIDVQSYYSGGRTVDDDEPIDPTKTDEYGGSENISATTMEKPADTNEGAGTTIAILDNEFYFRAKQVKIDEPEGTDPIQEVVVDEGFHHVTFSALPNDAVLKHKGHPDSWKLTIAYSSAKELVKEFIKKDDPTKPWIDQDENMGKEGSLYFNNKIPFYFDYGGEKEFGGDKPHHDLDVSSELTYHGSHVASIASGNDPVYKGIAPGAQLICMKVFTTYKYKGVDNMIGLNGVSSGAYDLPVLNALEDCITLGVDGINCSFGSNLNDFDQDTYTYKKLEQLCKSGILTSISAGNSGKATYESIGSYRNWTTDMVETGILSGNSNTAGATTVASGIPDKVFYENALELKKTTTDPQTGEPVTKTYVVPYDDQIVSRESMDVVYDPERPLSGLGVGVDIPWVEVPNYGTAADFSKVDVEGKIAVVSRGVNTFSEKYSLAAGDGALALAVINNDVTSHDFNFHMSFGDDFRPTIPCVLILRKDYEIFHNVFTGDNNKLKIVQKLTTNSEFPRTMSTFSSDGATFDLDLKPEITAPGDLIKGAVPPQKNADKQPVKKMNVYEFLSGTSMSAPNYAGAQSVVLSSVTKDIYAKEGKPTAGDLALIKTYKATVDRRLASTAVPMKESIQNPELKKDDPDDSEKIRTTVSPRRQGSGMANIGAALETPVYLDGHDVFTNKPSGKAKIALKNSEKINQGIIDLNFTAYNSDKDNAHTYDINITVMRPAVAEDNSVAPRSFKWTNPSTGKVEVKNYTNKGSIDSIANFPGHTYYVVSGEYDPTELESIGEFEIGDVYNVSRDIPYYATYEAAASRQESNKTIIKQGNWYCSAINVVGEGNSAKRVPVWTELPSEEYQSIQDVVIETVNAGSVTVPKNNKAVVSPQDIVLSDSAKEFINNHFDYGCYIEGYVTLTGRDNEPQLSIPYMGFYGAEGGSYESAPIHEPFSFEKDPYTIYPSYLVNDLAKNLLSKDKANMESLWVSGYKKDGDVISLSSVETNDTNLLALSGFHSVGTDPLSGKQYDDPGENIYVGSPYSSNTMIIQLFMMRSVFDNFISIKNKVTGQEVYRGMFEDIIYGNDDFDRGTLYKSHIDENFLGAGYICHRAVAQIPLYDSHGRPFDNGEYEISFNFLLGATNSWKQEKYNLHIDSEAPEISSVTEVGDKVRFNIRESNLCKFVYDTDMIELKNLVVVDEYNSYFELDKDAVETMLMRRFNYAQGVGRLYFNLTDKAYGVNGSIVKFDTTDEGDVIWNSYSIVTNHELKLNNDFRVNDESVIIVTYNEANFKETEVKVDGLVNFSRGPVVYTTTVTMGGGCGGDISTSSILLSSLALVSILGIGINLLRRRKLGGND